MSKEIPQFDEPVAEKPETADLESAELDEGEIEVSQEQADFVGNMLDGEAGMMPEFDESEKAIGDEEEQSQETSEPKPSGEPEVWKDKRRKTNKVASLMLTSAMALGMFMGGSGSAEAATKTNIGVR